MKGDKISIFWGWVYDDGKTQVLKETHKLQKEFEKDISFCFERLKGEDIKLVKVDEYFYVMKPAYYPWAQKFGILELASYTQAARRLVKRAYIPTRKCLISVEDKRDEDPEFNERLLKTRSNLINILKEEGFNILYYTHVAEI